MGSGIWDIGTFGTWVYKGSGIWDIGTFGTWVYKGSGILGHWGHGYVWDLGSGTLEHSGHEYVWDLGDWDIGDMRMYGIWDLGHWDIRDIGILRPLLFLKSGPLRAISSLFYQNDHFMVEKVSKANINIATRIVFCSLGTSDASIFTLK